MGDIENVKCNDDVEKVQNRLRPNRGGASAVSAQISVEKCSANSVPYTFP